MALEKKQEETEVKKKPVEPDSNNVQGKGDATESDKIVIEKNENNVTEKPDVNEPINDNIKMDEDNAKPEVNIAENDTKLDDKQGTKEIKTDNWKIEASDDEDEDEESAKKRRKGIWEPPLDVIVKLYEELDKKGVLELNWKCPGRKDLEEERREQEKEKAVVTEELVVPEEKEDEPTAFDDFEEDTTIMKITPRRTTGSDKAQGSGRKRTAKMESILGNMMRHKKIDEDMEKGKTDTEIYPMPKSDITPRRLGKIHIRNNIDS